VEIRVTQKSPEPMGEIRIVHQTFKNITIPPELIPNIIDEIPILSILATAGQGVLEVRNARELRVKESDRIRAIVENLRNVGVQIEELEDGFILEGPQSLKGGRVTTYGDHRIAMSFAVANLAAEGEILLDDPQCVDVSFPQFWELLKQVVQI
jgi:3-phosphoshikimate 1-carboxyvinyltransferase